MAIRPCIRKRGGCLDHGLGDGQNRAKVVADGDEMSIADRIREKLTRGLDPIRLEIVDESHRHAGHVGARDGGETHFRVEIVSAGFAGRSRVDRQRLVYGLLAEEMNNPVHALSIAAQTPDEAARFAMPKI